MDEQFIDSSPCDDSPTKPQEVPPVSGSYVGQSGSYRLELRVDVQQQGAQSLYRSLGLVSGDFYRDVGAGEWDHHGSFIVEHPSTEWRTEEVVITGTMVDYPSGMFSPPSQHPYARQLEVVIPLSPNEASFEPATVRITGRGPAGMTFLCQKTSAFLRIVDLEIDRITSTEIPRPFQTHALTERPTDLPPLELDITRAYQRAGIDMRLLSDSEVLTPAEAGNDLKWDEDELHNAMEHHFSLWRDAPQWKLYLLVATHFKLYPTHLVTGLMYDSQYRDPHDPFPRQGAAAFHSSMMSLWGNLSQAEFERNYLRVCVHELGHALNLLHPFDVGRPESLSWMNYPWRYPYGYDLPSGWIGTHEYWRNCRYEFDTEELIHLRHDPLLEVIPGGAAFGGVGQDLPTPAAVSPRQQAAAPVALYIRTRPERYLFDFAEPVTVELKLKNQTQAPMVVPDMLNPEFGLLELYIRDPKGQMHSYQPLFRLCSESRRAELPAGEKLYESVFLAYGAEGFYFEAPGEYQIWAVYGAGGLRIRSNALRIRVAFPQTADGEKMALWTFGRDQGHVLYMRGAEHLEAGNDQLREVTERFPTTRLARYIHLCFGNSVAREFKNVASGTVRPPHFQSAVQHLTEASKLLRSTQSSALDNITHGQVVYMLSDLYRKMDLLEAAESVLTKTVRYFTRMQVKPEVIDDMRNRARAIKAKK